MTVALATRSKSRGPASLQLLTTAPILTKISIICRMDVWQYVDYYDRLDGLLAYLNSI